MRRYHKIFALCALTAISAACSSKVKAKAKAAAAVAGSGSGTASDSATDTTNITLGGPTTVPGAISGEKGKITGAHVVRGAAKGQITANWLSVPGTANYLAVLSPNADCSAEAAKATTAASSTTFNNVPEGTYFLCVTANGVDRVLADSLGEVSVVGDWTPPGSFAITAPVGLIGDLAPLVKWNEPTGNPASYRVRVAHDADCFDVVSTKTDVTAHELTLDTLPGLHEYFLCIDAIDVAGNSSSAKGSFTTVARPTVTFIGLVDGDYLPTGSISSYHLAGTCSEAERDVTIGGAVSAVATCSTSHMFSIVLDYSTQAEGQVALTASQTNEIGIVSSPLSLHVVKDTTPPTATVTGTPPAVTALTTYNVVIGGASVVSYSAVQVTGDANCSLQTLGDWTPIATHLQGSSPQSDIHTICVLGQDAAGNIQATATKITWRVNQKPTLAFTAPTASSTIVLGRTFTTTFNAADAEEDPGVALYAGTGSASSCTDGSLTGYASIHALQHSADHSATFQPATTGDYRVCAKLTDGFNAPVYVVSPKLVVTPNTAPTIAITNVGAGIHAIRYKAPFTINYSAVDPDDNAAVSFYYKSGSASGCNSSLTSWFPIVTTRHVSDGGSYTWVTTSINYGNYYLCAKIDDGVNPAVFAASAGTVMVDRTPDFTLTSPTRTGASINASDTYAIQWISTDDDDATITLYLSETYASTCTGGTQIATGISALPNGAGSYTMNAASLAAGMSNRSYFICASVDDHVNPVITRWSRGQLIIKGAAPTVSVSAPTGHPLATNASPVAVAFAADDSGSSNANILFYVKTDSSGCTDGTLSGWTQVTSFPISTASPVNIPYKSGVATNTDLNICVQVYDIGSRQSGFALALGTVKFNAAPSLTFTTPPAESVPIGQTISYSITPTDPDNPAASYNVYPLSNCTGTPLYTGKTVAQGTFNFDIDTTGMTSGPLTLCAVIDDGINAPVTRAAPTIYLYDAICVWTGNNSTAWTNSGNWSSCPAGSPRATDFVDIPSVARQPLIASGTASAAGFQGTGGGTITVAAGATFAFGLGSTTAPVRSSITFVGDSTTCSTCNVTPSATVFVGAGSTLTLGNGIYLAAAVTVGSSAEAGNLIATGGGASNTYPRINGSISVTGAGAGARSSLAVNGLNGVTRVSFGAFTRIDQLDRLSLANGWVTGQSGIDLGGCSNLQLIDTTWANIVFSSIFNGTNNTGNIAAGGGCGSISLSVSGSGIGYGPLASYDPNSRISWTNGGSSTCVWTGGTDTSWSNPANWNNCNTRGGYPDQNDAVTIPSGTPVATTSGGGTATARAIVGAGGGSIQISTNSFLFIGGAVGADVSISGSSSTCNNCFLHVGGVDTDATLTMNGGVRNDSGISVGSGTSNGHLNLVAGNPSNSATWPVVTGGIWVQGPDSGHKSSIDINGLYMNPAGANPGLNLIDFYEVRSLSNISMDFPVSTGGNMMRIDNCAHADFTSTDWSLSFVQAISLAAASTYNVQVANCSSLNPSAINISPVGSGGAGYGAIFADDTRNVLSW